MKRWICKTVLFLLFFSCTKYEYKPIRPKNIEKEAIWVGGNDGGCWIYSKNSKLSDKNYFKIYFENGDLWEKGWFEQRCDSSFRGIESFNGNSIAVRQFCKYVKISD